MPARRAGSWRSRLLSLAGYTATTLLVLGLVGAVGLGIKLVRSDDPYYRDASCDKERERGRITITTAGFPVACAVTYDGPVLFVNRLTEATVTICMGYAGRCATGHGAPAELGQGVRLRPGESRDLRFPYFTKWRLNLSRNYPVTLTSDLGSAFARREMVVRRALPDA